MAQLKNTTIDSTGFLQLPAGTTGQRPGSPAAGQMRLNITTGKVEFYDNNLSEWLGTANLGVVASGGNSVYDVDTEGGTYRVHVFTSTGNSSFTVNQGGEVEYLIVAGGGGGGSGHTGSSLAGGGGGGGGLLTGTTTVTPQTYTITVGAGGTGANGPTSDGSGSTTGFPARTGANGGNSSVFGLTANGGGGGGTRNAHEYGKDGGSGGGHSGTTQGAGGGAGTAGQGNRGGNNGAEWGACGGGGAGGQGGDSTGGSGVYTQTPGGIGISTTITGTSVFYAGGGGGGGHNRTPDTERLGALGGLGGGGRGGNHPNESTGTFGTDNTGGGGGGSPAFAGNSTSDSNGGDGGDGIVIIRYFLSQENPVAADGKIENNALVLDLDFAKPTVYSIPGSNVNDSRLNGVTGSFVGNLNYVNPGSNRASLDYTASPYVNFGTSVNNLGLSVATIETVFKSGRTDGGFSLIAGWGNGTSYYSSIGIGNWFGGTPNESVHVGINTGATAGADQFTMFVQEGHAAYQDGNYHHIVAILAQNNYAIWIDGVQKTITFPNGIGQSASYSNIFGFDSSTTFELGRRPYGNGNFTGEINVFRLYNRILSNDEISNAFNTVRWRFGI